jgi:hypothetical protein
MSDDPTPRPDRGQQAVDALKALGGRATAHAIAAHLHLHPNGVTDTIRHRLIPAGIMVADGIEPQPGTKGRIVYRLTGATYIPPASIAQRRHRRLYAANATPGPPAPPPPDPTPHQRARRNAPPRTHTPAELCRAYLREWRAGR